MNGQIGVDAWMDVTVQTWAGASVWKVTMTWTLNLANMYGFKIQI